MSRLAQPRFRAGIIPPYNFNDVDNAHPLSEGLVAFFMPVPGGMRDAVTGRILLPRDDLVREDYMLHGYSRGATRRYSTATGPVYYNAGGNSDGGWYWPDVTSDDPWSLSTTDTASWAWRQYFDESGHTEDFPRIIDKSTGGSGADGYTIYETGQQYILRFNADADEGSTLVEAGASDDWSDFLFTRNGTTFTAYREREDRTFSAGVPAGNFPSTTTDLAIGTTAPSWAATERPWQGGIAYVAMWSGRELGMDDHVLLDVDPFSLILSNRNRTYSFASTASARTIDKITRLGLAGITRMLYGDFGGKAAAVVVDDTPAGGDLGLRAGRDWNVDPYEYETRRRRRIAEDLEAELDAQEALTEARAKAPRKRDVLALERGKAILARDDALRLMAALEAQERKDRNRRMAALLLLS